MNWSWQPPLQDVLGGSLSNRRVILRAARLRASGIEACQRGLSSDRFGKPVLLKLEQLLGVQCTFSILACSRGQAFDARYW